MKSLALLPLTLLLLACPIAAEEPVMPPMEEVIESGIEVVADAANNQAAALETYQRLLSGLGNPYPDTYAGAWLEGDALHIGITNDEPATLAFYDGLLMDAPCPIFYDIRPYSLNRLYTLQDDIAETMMKGEAAQAAYAINSVGVDVSAGTLGVTSEYGYTDATHDTLVALAEAHGMDADVIDLEAEAMTIRPEAGSDTPMPEDIHAPATGDPYLLVLLSSLAALGLARIRYRR